MATPDRRAHRRLTVEPLDDRVLPAVFYVAPNGSDAAAGTKSAPFATIVPALSRLQPGDEVRYRGGMYYPTK